MGTACGFPTIIFEGIKIYINDNIFDPDQYNKKQGMTNKELMKSGKAPIGKDGKYINLHHHNQNPNGPLIEMLASEHSKKGSGLHPMRRGSKINRSQFSAFKQRYWKYRYERFFSNDKEN